MLGKIGYFDESFRIPLVLRDPSPEAAGSRGRIVEQFTETIDVMPTILAWVGADVPRACDGRSLLPFLHGDTPQTGALKCTTSSTSGHRLVVCAKKC